MIKLVGAIAFLVLNLYAQEVYATFTVEAKHSANLAFNASGVVKVIDKEIAQNVKKGEVLASLDNRDKKATLAIAKTALKFAKKDYERQEKVKNLINADVFDTYAFKYENAKNQVALQEALLDKTVLRAPFNGVILYKNIDVGDTVSGLMLKTVYKIQSKSARKLIVAFDQKYYKSVKVGDTFKYKIDGDSKAYTGIISKIYPIADAQNRKIQAEVKANNFMVGLFGDGVIITK